jgi:hypothetical protein
MSTKKQTPAVPAAVKAEVTVFDKDTVTKYKTFDEMVRSIKAGLRELDKNQLLFNWNLGAQVKLVADGAVYGAKTVQDMADKLDCSDATLYAVKRLFETYPKEVIDKFIEKGLHYHTVSKLTAHKISEDERDSIVQKLLSGQVTNKDLPELLGKEEKAKKVEVEVLEDDPDDDEEDDEGEAESPGKPQQLHKAAVTDPIEDLENEVKNGDPKSPKAKIVPLLRAVDIQILQMEKSLTTIDTVMTIMEDVDDPDDIEQLMGRVGSSMANLQKLNMKINEVAAIMKRMAL